MSSPAPARSEGGGPRRGNLTSTARRSGCFAPSVPSDSAEPTLILRRANVSRKGGSWQHEDYNVFDGDREIERIHLIDSHGGNESSLWGVSFQLTGRKR
jgi:hypothetical protein